MAQIQEAAAIISEVLAVDPLMVQEHVQGLTAAGRLSGGKITAHEAADLLCAVLGTDANNATGLYHLPLAGVAVLEQDTWRYLEPRSLVFESIVRVIPTFGDAAAVLIAAVAVWGTSTQAAAHNLFVSGRDDRNVASLHADLYIEETWRRCALSFGYYEPAAMAGIVSRPLPRLEKSHFINGECLRALGQAVAGENFNSAFLHNSTDFQASQITVH